MKTNKIFLKKVYDKHLSIDWNVGKADLNPVREIKFYDYKDSNDELASIREMIKINKEAVKKVAQAKGLIPISLLEEKDEDINFNTALTENLKKSDLNDLLKKQKAGSVGDSIFNLANATISDIIGYDPLIKDLDDMIIQIGPSILTGIPSIDTPDKDPDYKARLRAFDPTKMPQGPVCKSQINLSASISSSSNNNPDTTSTSAADQSAGEASDSALAEAKKINDTAKSLLEQYNKQSEEDNSSLQECVLGTLGLLKVIQIIIVIISVIKMILAYVLGIIVPIAEIVSLAGGLWVNPSGMTEIVSKLSQTAIAIITKIVSDLLAKLIAMLNANCLVQSSLNDLDNMLNMFNVGLKTLDDTGDAFSMLKGIAKVIAVIKQQVSQQIEEGKKKSGNLWKSLSSKDFWKQTASTLGNDTVNSLKASGNQLLNTAKNAISPEIEAVNNVKATIQNTKDTIENLINSTYGDVIDTVKMFESYKNQEDN
jgi:hypothetical protein